MHAELLSELRTILGGNGSARRKSEMDLTVLKEIGHYCNEALKHVLSTRDVLQAVAADTEELRDRAAAPAIVGDRVPSAVLVRSIGDGIERLKEGRQSAAEGGRSGSCRVVRELYQQQQKRRRAPPATLNLSFVPSMTARHCVCRISSVEHCDSPTSP
ncbi:uncharacterized protein B0H18DRAFT_306780 [Fomitopsis serialis]|uniref:uncharacterized protein n=1 Tax=Fomitopsis serialis TaxID=139415 RepID=UPI002008B6FA|nr:uncharacterized protein B0H18DRAFT_306780 [Neoantrodia serialis]KAH9927014.1 hypothetical protein B0H18DRAFT_306780 [Neoantrodia serialis]